MSERGHRLIHAELPSGRSYSGPKAFLCGSKTRRDLRHVPQARRAFAEIPQEPPPRGRLSLASA